jgi:hypothetical protein
MLLDRWLAVVGLAGTFIGTVLSIIFYLRGRRDRRLDVVWTVRVLQSKKHPRVKIYFDEREVSSLAKARILFYNAGHEAVRRSDMPTNGDFTIRFPGISILSVACVGDAAKTAAACTVIAADEAKFSFEYLNPGQAVVVELLVSGELRPEIIGEIIGGKINVRSWFEIDSVGRRMFRNLLELLTVTFVISLSVRAYVDRASLFVSVLGFVVLSLLWIAEHVVRKRIARQKYRAYQLLGQQ